METKGKVWRLIAEMIGAAACHVQIPIEYLIVVGDKRDSENVPEGVEFPRQS